jgi:hypothetical protein
MAIVFLGGAGLFLIWLALCMYRHRARVRVRAMATLAWPRAPWRVTASWIGKTTMPGEFAYPGIIAHEPQVSYSYEVAATTYQGVRISFAKPIFATKKRAAGIVARYPAGAEVQVAYDPANPRESVLEQSLKGTSPIDFNVIAMFALGVMAIVRLFWL